MIYLEDYDLPVIVLNGNTFILAAIYLLNISIGDVCLVSDVGFWNMANLMLSLVTLLTAISVATCVSVDIWWIRQKIWDNDRWL